MSERPLYLTFPSTLLQHLLQEPLESSSLASLPFRIVSSGLEGESVLVPTDVGNVDATSRGDGTAKAIGTTEGWREAISTSTLPFGAYSLPQLAPSSRRELEDR